GDTDCDLRSAGYREHGLEDFTPGPVAFRIRRIACDALGAGRSARALPGVSSPACQPGANWPRIAHAARVERHGTCVPEGARIAARAGETGNLVQRTALGESRSVVERAFSITRWLTSTWRPDLLPARRRLRVAVPCLL